MNFLELAQKRYSVRNYTNQPVAAEHINLILEAGRVAPTGANKQPYHLLVVTKEEELGKFKGAANIYDAPLAILVCAKNTEAWVRPFDNKNLAEIDATIVTDHMMLQATDLGLGSLWICYFDPAVIKTAFALPEDLEPLHILAIGHGNDTPLSPDRHGKTRKTISQTVSFEVI